MTIDDDAAKLLAFMDTQGLDASTHTTRGWTSIGAIVVDACLQRRQNYKKVVKPRVLALISDWPDAATTSGMRRRLNTGALPRVINWHSPNRLVQISEVTGVLEHHGIETVQDLREALADSSTRPLLRATLRAVRNVGPKTLDYFDILCGLPGGVAIDVRIRRVAKAAGISNMTYEHISAVIRSAAQLRGWRAGDLDATLWSLEPDILKT